MGAISAPSDRPSEVATRSGNFWTEALGRGRGLTGATRALALATLPRQLAVAFRGVLSFWTAGDIADASLAPAARAAAAAVLLGFADREHRSALALVLESDRGAWPEGSPSQNSSTDIRSRPVQK